MKELKIYLRDDGKISCFLRKDRLCYYEEITMDEAKKILSSYFSFKE